MIAYKSRKMPNYSKWEIVFYIFSFLKLRERDITFLFYFVYRQENLEKLGNPESHFIIQRRL